MRANPAPTPRDPAHLIDWPALQQALAQVVTVTSEWPTGLAATCDGHRLLIDHATGLQADWLVLRAEVCRQDEMDLEATLERNGNLAVASLMLIKGSYWLRLAVPCDSVDARDLPRLISLCLQAARAISPVHVTTKFDASRHFSHYAD